ncbi:MAG: hypothetical protein ACR2IN_02415 [Thermoleophilaceae bacterium]
MEGSGADERWRVPLPDAAHPPLEVFVNGVPQDEGRDYSIEPHGDGRALAFSRPLQKEGRLGFWRWALMFFAIVGTYRKHDSVDVRYRAGDETRLATGLAIVAPKSVSP